MSGLLMRPATSFGELVRFKCPRCSYTETAHPEHAVRCPHCGGDG